jgi:hypothetical protein
MRLSLVACLAGCAGGERRAREAPHGREAEACTHGPPVPVEACGPPEPQDVLCREDYEGCRTDADCALATLDPCCGLVHVAVLARRAEAVARRIGGCSEPHACPACVTYLAPIRCRARRCELVADAPAGLSDSR